MEKHFIESNGYFPIESITNVAHLTVISDYETHEVLQIYRGD